MNAEFDSIELAAAIRESTATLIKPNRIRKIDRQVYGVKKTKYSCYLYDPENPQKTHMWKDLMVHSEENF